MDGVDVTGNTGTRVLTLALFGGELSGIISDSRWLLLAIFVCVAADFRYGWGESSLRYERARRKGDKVVMSQYRWRTSRAVRRTVNKLVDYVVWICVGVAIGMAVLAPLGVSYNYGGLAAAVVAIACEAKSFIGHFFYLHGIRVEGKGMKAFFRAFAVAFAKKKDKDVGEAVEAGFKELDKKENNDNNETGTRKGETR